ncbi:MAG: hypothetical protein WC247_03930 [Porticoccaceae bacterium]|jgi:hypothetical protein
MKRSDILRILLVCAILAPLVVIQTGPGAAPAWMNQRLAGVPLTVVATALWFLVMMSLTALFARQQTVADRISAARIAADGALADKKTGGQS